MRALPVGVTIGSGADFADHDELTRELLAIDEVVYGELSREDTGPVDYWDEVDPYSFYRIARDGDRVIGYVDIHRFPEAGVAAALRGEVREGDLLPWLDRSGSRRITLYIGSVAVLPEYRGKGVGHALIETCIREAKAEGYEVAAVYATLWSEGFWASFHPAEVARDALGHRVVRLDELAAP